MGNMVDRTMMAEYRAVLRDAVMFGLLCLCVAGLLASIFLGVRYIEKNGPAERVPPQAVRLTTLEKSLSDIAPALAASGISRISFPVGPRPFSKSSVAAIGTVDSVRLYVKPPASSMGSAFDFNLVVQGDSLEVEVYETTALPPSVNDAESFIRSLANHAITTMQSRQQYGLQPVKK